MTMQIAFYKGRGKLFNRLVSWWLRGPYSHVELVMYTEANGTSKCASSSYEDKGVRIKYMKLNPLHWDLIPIKGSLIHVDDWITTHDKEKYDILGILGFVWRPIPESKTKWMCSEAVASMLGWKEAWRLDPMSLWSAVSTNK